MRPTGHLVEFPQKDLPRDEVEALCRQIVVMVPHRSHEGIHALTAVYSHSWVASGILWVPWASAFDGFLESTRNIMAQHFLKKYPDRKYLVLIDNDVAPVKKEAPILLARHGLPVVSGCVPGWRPDMGTFLCVTVMNGSGEAAFPSVSGTRRIPARGLSEIKQAGTGMLCIRRDVLESVCMRDDPFSIPHRKRIDAVRIGSLPLTEDVAFCDRVRAAGYRLWVDWEVHGSHDKTLTLVWDRSRIDESLDPAEFEVVTRKEATE